MGIKSAAFNSDLMRIPLPNLVVSKSELSPVGVFVALNPSVVGNNDMGLPFASSLGLVNKSANEGVPNVGLISPAMFE